MPRFRAGAFDKGSKRKGRFVVVDAATAAQAVLDVRHYFPGVPLQRLFAREAEGHDKPTTDVKPFTLPKPADARRGAG